MLLKTHLAVGLAVAFYFLPHVQNRLAFVVIVLFASVLPDLESEILLDKHKKIKLFGMIGKNSFLHTYTACLIATGLFAFFAPIVALPFFLGYSFHLAVDAFSREGIAPFWPFTTKRASGKITPGGHVDYAVFSLSLIFAALMLIKILIQ